MLKWLRNPFGRELKDVVGQTKRVVVHGVPFKIRKVNPVDFLNGSEVMLKEFDTYKPKAQEIAEAQLEIKAKKALEQMQRHYRDVFMSAVVDPKLVRKPEDAGDGALFVDFLFTEWDLANELYAEIVAFTYGKKKSSLGL